MTSLVGWAGPILWDYIYVLVRRGGHPSIHDRNRVGTYARRVTQKSLLSNAAGTVERDPPRISSEKTTQLKQDIQQPKQNVRLHARHKIVGQGLLEGSNVGRAG
jgi:hypothetical protein